MKKPRITEEFLWKLHEAYEALANVQQKFGVRSMNEALMPEMRKLRLAYERKRRKKSYSQFISYLKQRGYIKIAEGTEIFSPRLTEKGKQKALEVRLKITEWPRRKDGKVVMLMYDIPENKRYVRHAFRNVLELLEYQMLQKSVWVSSKDVLAETEKAIHSYGLGDCVNLFVMEQIESKKRVGKQN